MLSGTVPNRVARGLAAVVLATTTLVATTTAASAADAPTVRDVQPVPGEVVQAGLVEVAAVLHTASDLDEVSLTVDGVEHEITIRAVVSGGQRLAASLDLAHGHHIAVVHARDLDGQSVQRAWRFAASDLQVRRLAGTDRAATAAALSRHAFPVAGSATGAVIATAGDYPDGLAAAPLAVQVGGPLLLSGQASLSPVTADELTRAVASGSTVTLLGGVNALSDEVADAVAALGFVPVRIAGAGRAETAAAIARHLPDPATAFLVSGRGFADGLAAAAPAARDGSPILLTEADELSEASRAYLVEQRPERVVIVGGTAAVSGEVEDEVRALVPAVERIAGVDRYATAAAVVDAFAPDAGAEGVALASGADFPDALAGGPHAAMTGVPLLLTPPDRMHDALATRLANRAPARVFLYGGAAALSPGVEHQLRIGALDGAAGPVVVDQVPAPLEVVNTLDTIELGLDRGVDLNHSTLHATLAGQEIPGVTAQGDFTDRLVLQLGSLPFDPQPDTDYPVEVHGQAYDGEHWRHVTWTFSYRRVALARGDSGEAVLAIQQRLTDLGYWLGEPDGAFGSLTSQALMAFQKYEELPRTGVADEATRARLEFAGRPTPEGSVNGRWVEIDKGRQVMLFVNRGVVEWAMNTSTGTEQSYTRPDGTTGFAHTPEGWFTFFRQIDGMREADLGQMWRPKYFTNAGHAIHGSTSIPAYPASHGCARLSYPAIDFVWSAGLVPMGTPVFVYA